MLEASEQKESLFMKESELTAELIGEIRKSRYFRSDIPYTGRVYEVQAFQTILFRV
jgi:hypothetical protein